MVDKTTYQNCPHCGGEVYANAIKCKHCKSSLEEATLTVNSYENEAVQTEKGFLRSLFDTSMREMITPKIIRFIFIIGLIAYVLTAVVVIIGMLMSGEIMMALLAIIVVPIGFIIAVVFMRIYLEIIIILFRIYDELRAFNRGAQ